MIAIKVSRCHRCLQIRSRECDGAHSTNARIYSHNEQDNEHNHQCIARDEGSWCLKTC